MGSPLTIPPGTEAPRRMPVRRRRSPTATLFVAYDWALAFLAILVSTDVLNRFGLNSPVWLLVYALVLARIVLAWNVIFPLLARNVLYLAFPAVCLASVIWSVLPDETLRAAIQLMMTVIIAIFIGLRFSLKDICRLNLWATFIGVFLSLVNLATGAFGAVYGASGGLLGIFTHKNMLGQRSLYTTLSIVTLLLAEGRGTAGFLVRLVLLGCLAIALAMIAMSLSVTAILMVPMFVGLLLALNYRRLPPAAIVIVLLGGTLAVAAGPLLLMAFGIDPVAAVLGAFGKDSTLTGRTDLWGIASQAIAEYPLLGVGYSAFWEAPRFANFALLAQHIGGEAVAGFHNFLLEVSVGTGLLGILAMILLIGTTVWRSGRLFLITRTPFAAYALVGTLSAIVLALLTTGLYRQHEYLLMFVVTVGVSAGQELDRRTARPVPPPAPQPPATEAAP